MSKLYTCTKCGKKKQENEFYKGYKGQVRSWCKKCYSEDNQERYRKNPDNIKQKRKEYYEQNKDSELEKMKVYYDNNKEAFLEYSSRRGASKRNACPTWLSEKHRSEIKSIYKMARNISKKTGVQHHVDHIIPLTNDLVCGLHVPWNLQVLPAKDNLSKHNSFVEEMVCSLEKSKD